MNSTFYIFGKFNGSYAQFPVDYTQDIFQQLPNRSSFSNTQLVIHRDNNLMYYCYMRKLEQDNFIGFCLLLNDAMIEEIPALFDHFDQAVTQLALKGEIIKINDQGDVVSNTDSLLTNQQAIKQTASSLFAQLSSLVAAKKTLPTQTFACDRDETKTFMLTANNISWILESSLRNAYTIITKEDNSSNLDTYQQTIKRLQKEKEELISVGKSVDSKNVTSRMTLIFALSVSILLLGCFVIQKYNQRFVFDKNSVVQTEENKNEKNTTLHSKSWSASFYGDMAGFPMKLKLTIDDKQQISGFYRNIKYGTVLKCTGNVNSNGSYSINAMNQSEHVIFELSLNGDYLNGFGSNGTNHLDVHLIKENYSKKTISELATIVHLWNDKHIQNPKIIRDLKTLYADEVLFYGNYLTAQVCVDKIISIVENIDDYSQILIGDIEYTKQSDGSFRCDFTKQVHSNGTSKNYPAYIVVDKRHDQWVIICESDLQTDAYFERLKRKKR